MRSLKIGKAPGPDNISAEILKAGDVGSDQLHPLIAKIWHEEESPEDWMQRIIVKLAKNETSHFLTIGGVSHCYRPQQGVGQNNSDPHPKVCRK